ncbi:hypothetical protein Mx9_p15 [Myxococcus phage Mx9]|nr:hypothetical protein Mx9_p15 [Myxococcus phage Mx9]
MRRVLLLALVALPALAGQTSEVLVGTTPTALPFFPTRRGLLIENRGPNAIWCAMSASAAVVGRSHRVGPNGDRFPFNAPDQWWCVAETAAQIRARYVAEKATACVGERCAYLMLEGGVNSLRIGNAPAAVLADMVWVVDDALSKGYGVVWTDVMPYAGNAGSGTDPLGQATTYNALWAAACAARASSPALRCLANYDAFVDPARPGYLREEYSCDGVHLTQAGANLFAARLASSLLAIPPP